MYWPSNDMVDSCSFLLRPRTTVKFSNCGAQIESSLTSAPKASSQPALKAFTHTVSFIAVEFPLKCNMNLAFTMVALALQESVGIIEALGDEVTVGLKDGFEEGPEVGA